MSRSERLPGQREALGLYLQDLLRPPGQAHGDAVVDLAPPVPVALPLPKISTVDGEAQPPAGVFHGDAQPLAEVFHQVKPAVAPAPPAPPAPPASPQAAVDWPPSWGRSRFPCLIFNVAGLRLAVPLIKLAGVLPYPEGLTLLPGGRPWLLGVTRQRGQNVRVIDTGAIVLPDRQKQDRDPQTEAAPSHLILIHAGRWALACHGISETLNLLPDAVRWRTSRSKRPWLAGTVLDKMCALLDVEALVARLEQEAGKITLPQPTSQEMADRQAPSLSSTTNVTESPPDV